MQDLALLLSMLGVGGVLGILAKAFFDKRQLKFSKVFEYKETRYKVISILMWAAMNPTEHEFSQLKVHRPRIDTIEKLNKELDLEYHQAMLYASPKVLERFKVFKAQKNLENWEKVAKAMKKDLYL